ncbi:MAG: hypothetical protein KAY09_05885, partial [Nitrospira sp.]|nr:hypothetical protein [Nitrospira sp.]
GRPAVLFVLRVLISSHGKGLLLHVGVNAWSVLAVDLISVALDWERLVSELERDSALRRRVLAAPFSNEWPDLQLAQWICRAIDARLAALAVLVSE